MRDVDPRFKFFLLVFVVSAPPADQQNTLNPPGFHDIIAASRLSDYNKKESEL
jgi:hypothetical protein